MTAFIRVKLARTIHHHHRNNHHYSSLLYCLSLLLTSPTLAFTTAPLHRHTSIMSSSTSTSSTGGDATFTNKSTSNNIPTYDGDSSAKATDFANYFCAYSQLYHQKQMLTDHNRMAAYHAAICGNADLFKDKVVMDVGTGSGILAVWAAQAGAKRVYAVEYTDMARHARRVVEANGVGHIVTVIQGAVEDIVLPTSDYEEGLLTSSNDDESNKTQVIDIIISEWMGYFLLRESMLDSLVRARDKFLKPNTGIMMPSHATMLLAPIIDEEERRLQHKEYANAMEDWKEFATTTSNVYGVDMSVLEHDFDREQKEYYVLSSRWAELNTRCLLAPPCVVKELDMHVCSVEDARGVGLAVGMEEGGGVPFEFHIEGRQNDDTADCDMNNGEGYNNGGGGDNNGQGGYDKIVSGFAGWFTVDFKSRTDEIGKDVAPPVPNPTYLSTGPEMGYTHWGQQVFHLPAAIPVLSGQTTTLQGTMEMMRTKESARLYNVRYRITASRKMTGSEDGQGVLMKGEPMELVYQIP